MRFTSLTVACLVLVCCTLLLPQEIESHVFKPCELARYLATRPGIQRRDIPTWVCIAKKESGFNSRAVSPQNRNRSRDHGLFQINDLYWCTAKGAPGKGCNAQCSKFEDDDIADDVRCVLHILAETRRLKGNGFKAWTTYKFCDTPGKVSKDLKHCKY